MHVTRSTRSDCGNKPSFWVLVLGIMVLVTEPCFVSRNMGVFALLEPLPQHGIFGSSLPQCRCPTQCLVRATMVSESDVGDKDASMLGAVSTSDLGGHTVVNEEVKCTLTHLDCKVETTHNPAGHKGNAPKRSRRDKSAKNDKPKGPAFHAKRVRPRIPILQYTNDWVCVNKPAGMTVHRHGDSARRHDLVVSTTLKRQLSRKVWPVHRLDHRTSGALLFAFNSHVCGQLHDSLTNKDKDGGAVKEYIAMVRGDWTQLPETVVVDSPLIVDGVEKECHTEFRLLASMSKPVECDDSYSSNNSTYQYQGACSLVQCRLLSGRKHQIRRHAYAIGHPVLGDTEHGDSRCNRWWRQNRGLDRLFLHCLSLDLPPLPQKSQEEEQNTPIEMKSDSGNTLLDNMAALQTTKNTAKVTTAGRTRGEDEEESVISPPTSTGDRIRCIAPLPDELSKVLRLSDMQDLWDIAREKDPRLALPSRDEVGGTIGRRATARQQI